MIPPDTTSAELLATPIGVWTVAYAGRMQYQNIRGKDCMISLALTSARNRGNWIAAVEVLDPVALHLDWADAFPRYYFDENRAKAELEQWLAVRHQLWENKS